MPMLEHELYIEDIIHVAELPFDWNRMRDKAFMIAGASGMIGSFLVDVLMYKNKNHDLKCTVYALGRSEVKAKERFQTYWNDGYFQFLKIDINEPLTLSVGNVDYILQAASNTHPRAYATDPIGTILTNVIGTDHLLEFACQHHNERFLFASSVEVYGENRQDADKFKEDYCGNIDSNTLRAGYPESKRTGEALCQAYMEQKGLDIVIPRLARTYGPTMLMSDTKAISQFIKKGIAREDIILKSKGKQLYSYTYVVDAVAGVLTCLFKGEKGEAYNVVGEGSDIMLKDLAQLIADAAGTKVIFEIPDEIETKGYSKAQKAVLDGSKLAETGWKAIYDIAKGIQRTIDILREFGGS